MKTKEILFEREINIDATIKNIEKTGFGKMHDPHRYLKPLLFGEEKSIKEIKSSLLKAPRVRLSQLMLVGMGAITGTGLGIVIGVLIHGDVPFLSFLAVLFLLIVAIIFSFSVRDVARKWQKWIFFPNPNTVVFAGNFTEEYINNFKKHIIWKKTKQKSKAKKKK